MSPCQLPSGLRRMTLTAPSSLARCELVAQWENAVRVSRTGDSVYRTGSPMIGYSRVAPWSWLNMSIPARLQHKFATTPRAVLRKVSALP